MKEAFVAFLAVAVLIVLLAVCLLLPRRAGRHAQDAGLSSTRSTSRRRPSPSSTGRVGTASYGPPVQLPRPTASQHIGFFEPEQWFGVHQPIDTAQDFVIGPLRTLPNQPLTKAAITLYTHSSAAQQCPWTTAYEKAVANATDVNGQTPRARRALRACRPHDRLPHRNGPDGRSRRHAVQRGAVLQHELHQATVVPRRRHLPGRQSPGTAPLRGASGE